MGLSLGKEKKRRSQHFKRNDGAEKDASFPSSIPSPATRRDENTHRYKPPHRSKKATTRSRFSVSILPFFLLDLLRSNSCCSR